MAGSFSIAFVCTGNRFRSPLAYAFVKRLTLGLPVDIVTAGTLDIADAPVLPEANELGTWCGIDLSGHRSQPLWNVPMEELDLVLGFEDEHVRHAVVEAGAVPNRSFTFRHFVQLLSEIDPPEELKPAARARLQVQRADELRRQEGSVSVGGDVPDPFGGPWNVYRDSAAEIRELSLELVARLFDVTSDTGLPPIPDEIGGRRRFGRSARRRSLLPRRRR
jgi:protein-tyrosine phosphatase